MSFKIVGNTALHDSGVLYQAVEEKPGHYAIKTAEGLTSAFVKAGSAEQVVGVWAAQAEVDR